MAQKPVAEISEKEKEEKPFQLIGRKKRVYNCSMKG
jgi:hypothetical protein